MEINAYAWLPLMGLVNMYAFMLISVLVIDEYGEGIPVACAITNREDTTILI